MRVSTVSWQLIVTYFTGVVTTPLLQRAMGSVMTEARKRWEGSVAARRVVATQLDPLLKAADELHGKLRSLGEQDFREFRTMPAADLQRFDLVNLCSTLYLFAQFWARLEILRRESFHADLARNRHGKMLLRFLRCLESRRVRLVDRAWQRAIGESVIVRAISQADVVSFKAFVEQYDTIPALRGWVQPLEEVLRQTKFPRARQRVLQYGVPSCGVRGRRSGKHCRIALRAKQRPRPSSESELAGSGQLDGS